MEKVDRSNRKWSSYLSGVGGELLGRAVYRCRCGAVVSSSWWNPCIFWVKIKYEFGGTYLQQLIKERLHLI